MHRLCDSPCTIPADANGYGVDSPPEHQALAHRSRACSSRARCCRSVLRLAAASPTACSAAGGSATLPCAGNSGHCPHGRTFCTCSVVACPFQQLHVQLSPLLSL